jgi:hypothetical protein
MLRISYFLHAFIYSANLMTFSLREMIPLISLPKFCALRVYISTISAQMISILLLDLLVI